MEKNLPFYALKIAKKPKLTKSVFALEFIVPEELKQIFSFKAGQYVAVKFRHNGEILVHDYTITSAPYEEKIAVAVKINSEYSSANSLYQNYNEGDTIEVSAPQGRFTLPSKPHEFRTILGFAGGIGITPVISHFKNILHSEPRTRLFLFYSNRTTEDIIFKTELDALVAEYGNRLQIYYFLTSETTAGDLYFGRIDEQKLKLIINQLLHLDDTDEESTIWDSVDEVLICGKGEMIKEIANACYQNGIPKKNIHFELFESFNEDIYPQEKEFPIVENIQVDSKINNKDYTTTLPDNKNRLLQSLLIQRLPVPYSCKSGICGSCICKLKKGEVEVLENEFLTEKEAAEGKILACMSVMLSNSIEVDFDLI